MNTPVPPRTPLRLEDVLPVLPDVPELQPALARLVGATAADPERRWTASGELGTTGGRVLDPATAREALDELVIEESRRLARRFARVADIVETLSTGDAGAVVSGLLDESGALESEAAHAEAYAWAERAARLALRIGDGRAAEALRRAARCARGAGDLPAAASLYEEGWRRARDDEHGVDAVVSATGRGNVAVDRGRWEHAELWYGRALDVLDATAASIGPADAASLRWRIFQNLGITRREQGAFEEAEQHYLRAEETAAPLGDPAARIEIENGRGQLELALGRPRHAEARFRAALEELDAAGPTPSGVRVAVRVNLGEALLRQGRAVEAGEAGRDAEAEAIRGRVLGRLPETYRLLARVARAREEAEAFVFLDHALELVRTHGLPRFEEAATLDAWAELAEADGDDARATDARTAAREIRAALADTSDSNTEEGDTI